MSISHHADLLLANALLPSGERAALALAGGRILALDPPGSERPANATLDLAGALVLPGLVEAHVHLDKTFLGDDAAWRPHVPASSIRERVAWERELRPTLAPVERRARALLERALARGTTALRTHVDIDPVAGLGNLEGVLAARERFAGRMTIQIVAFPQSGIITAPGTAALLDAALASGADLIGGLDPLGFDGDLDGHLDVVFGLAERRGVGVDLHLHDGGLAGIRTLEAIARRTVALGMQGRVAVDHAYALGEVPDDVLRRTAEALAEAGVSIITSVPGTHPFPPILPLRAAEVNVVAASDNIRDVWEPYGDADLLERAWLAAYRSGFVADEELRAAFDLVTAAPVRALGLAEWGLAPGCRADLVVVDAGSVMEAVVARPARRLVLSAGRVVARDGVLVNDMNGRGELDG